MVIRNDLKCVEWDIKPLTTTTNTTTTTTTTAVVTEQQWKLSANI